MRVVVDTNVVNTNVVVSALLLGASAPGTRIVTPADFLHAGD